MISKALSLVTEDGFVFRVDVGLRPEGKSGDMAVSLRSAEIYYESWASPGNGPPCSRHDRWPVPWILENSC